MSTLIINTIPTQTVGTPFNVTGSYQFPTATWNENLSYEDDGQTSAPITATPVNTLIVNYTIHHAGNLPVGTHTVSVKDPFTGDMIVSNSFLVTGVATIVVAVPVVSAGALWTLSGALSGYPVAPSLTYRLDGGAATAIPSGDVTTTTFSLPNLLPLSVGNHTVQVSDGTVSSVVVQWNVALPPGIITITSVTPPPITPPAPAAAAGFTTRSFGPTIVVGTDPTLNVLDGNWVPANFDGIAWRPLIIGHNSDGSITIPPNIINGFGAQLSSASFNPTPSPYYRGVAFGGGGYFEVTLSYTWNSVTGGPAFWMNDIESTMGGSAGDVTLRQWPGQAVGYGDWIEWDVFEQDAPSVGGAGNGQMGFALHNWYGMGSSPLSVNSTGSGSVWTLPGGTDFTLPHRYGGLWTPATGSSQGSIKWYFDGVQVGHMITWNQYNPALAPPPVDTGTGGSSAYSIIDVRHMFLILGNANTVGSTVPSPVTVYKVEVWQNSIASNWISGAFTLPPANTILAGQPFILAGTTSGYLTIPSLAYFIDNNPNPIHITGNTLTSFSITVTAPGVGTHTISVTDGTITSSANLVVNAPSGVITVFAPSNTVTGQTFTFTGNLVNYPTIPALTYSIDGGTPVAITGVSVTGWSMTITAPAVGNHTIVVTDGTVSGSASFTTIAQTLALRQFQFAPGRDDGFWSSPFYTGANFLTSGALVNSLRWGVSGSTPTASINLIGNFSAPWYVGGPGDPLVQVTDGSHSIFVRIPLGSAIETPSSGFDQTIGGADSTQPYLVWSISGATMNTGTVASSGSIITGTYGFTVQDGSGPMMEDQVTGIQGANNAIGGVMDYHLTAARLNSTYVIPTMLAFQMDPRMVTAGAPSPVYPLLAIDGGASYTGSIPQGITIGIPPNTVRPTGKTRGWYMLFDNLRERGWFNYNFGAAGNTFITCYSTLSANAALVADLQASISEVIGFACILNYANGVNGAQYSQATLKGKTSGATYATTPPLLLDLSPTGGVNVSPSSFGAWYPSGYNVTPTNTPTNGSGPNPPPTTTGTTIWNTPFNGSSTLSNGGLTITAGGSGTAYSTPQGAVATTAISGVSKIIVWEIGVSGISQNFAVGVADSTFTSATGGGAGGAVSSIALYPSTGAGSQPAQTVYYSGNQLTAGNGVSSAIGDTITLATNGTTMWVSDGAMRSTSGVQWNNSTAANPLTGVGGFPFASIATPYYPLFYAAEAGGIATINDGTSGFSSFATQFISSSSGTAVALTSLNTSVPGGGTKTISPNAPAGAVTNAAFTFSGSLFNYPSIPVLTYSIDGSASQPITNVTILAFSVSLTIVSAGSHTIVVTDGTISGTVTFTVTAANQGVGTRVTAPLTGPVAKRTWVTNQKFPLAGSPSGLNYMQYNYLLPAQYDSNLVYPILFVGHPIGSGGNPYPLNGAQFVINESYGVGYSLDTMYNSVVFSTAHPCILVAVQCDQTNNSGGTAANGVPGYNDTGPNGSWNERAEVGIVQAFLAGTILANLKVDPTSVNHIGYSLGGIDTLAQMVDNNAYNGPGFKIWTAGATFSDQLFRSNTSNSSYFARMATVPLATFSFTGDNVPGSYDQPAYSFSAGGSTNYPTKATYDSGGMAACRAGTSNYYYINNGSSNSATTFMPMNALGGDGDKMYAWLFSQVGPGSLSQNTTLSGITISANSIPANSAVNTSIGTISVTSTGAAPTGVILTISSQSTAGAFSINGATLRVANGTLAAGTYTVGISVTATNATNAPQIYPITITVTSATARYIVVSGKLNNLVGAQFKGGGINITESELGTAVTNAACQPMTTLFPHINIVRLAAHSYLSVASVQSFVTSCTNAGIIIEIENHQSFNANGSSAGTAGGGTGVIYTGQNLATESAWYTTMASAFAGNPRVWFGTNNEPSVVDPNTGQTNVALLSAWHLATYTAIRNAGNNNPILLCVNGPTMFGTAGGMTQSSYSNMTNVMWDMHFYNWVANFSTDPTTINNRLNQMIGLLGTITSRDGVIPVCSLEYGNSTNGSSVDAGGTQNDQAIQAAVTDGRVVANAAWIWDNFGTGAADQLRVGSSLTLSAYGQQVSTWIANAPLVG